MQGDLRPSACGFVATWLKSQPYIRRQQKSPLRPYSWLLETLGSEDGGSRKSQCYDSWSCLTDCSTCWGGFISGRQGTLSFCPRSVPMKHARSNRERLLVSSRSGDDVTKPKSANITIYFCSGRLTKLAADQLGSRGVTTNDFLSNFLLYIGNPQASH